MRICFCFEGTFSFIKFFDLKHPVEISAHATQTTSSKMYMVPKKLFIVLSNKSSSVRVPGEITLTTSLLRGPFFNLDLASSTVSVCSQTATLKPFFISFGK